MKTHKSIWLRHGQSLYKGVIPDLTQDGILQVTQAGQEIVRYLGGRVGSVELVTSPQPRAVTSAHVLAGVLGYDREKIQIAREIRCTDFYTDFGRKLPWPLLEGETSLELAYITHPRFDEGIHFEKRLSVKTRFFQYLESLFHRFSAGELPDVRIHTSHYEVLHQMIKIFGMPQPLTYAEPIILELTRSSIRGSIRVVLRFRSGIFGFDIEPPFSLRDQFGQ